MKVIFLTKGWDCWVDDDDYEYLKTIPWRMHKGAAISNVNRTTIKMHRLVMNARKNQEVDHRIKRDDEKVVDNRKSNLRFVNHSQNIANSYKKKIGKTSIFKGVSRSKNGKWRAQLKTPEGNKHLGYFVIEVCAAYAYDLAALSYHGSCALTNFPLLLSERWLYGPTQ